MKNKKAEVKENEEEEDYPIPEFMKTGDPYYKSRIKNFKYFNRGIYEKPKDFDVKFENKKRKKISEYDRYLKKFEYKNALISVLRTNQTDIIVSLIEELIERSALKAAMRGFDDKEIEMFTKFAGKKVSTPKYSSIILYAINVFVDLYSSIKNPHIIWLQSMINNEILVQEELKELCGALDVLVETGLVFLN